MITTKVLVLAICLNGFVNSQSVNGIQRAWAQLGFDGGGSGLSPFVTGPSNSALLGRFASNATPTQSLYERPSLVVTEDNVAVLGVGNQFIAADLANASSTAVWKFNCASGMVASGTPALISVPEGAYSLAAVVVICQSASGSTVQTLFMDSGATAWSHSSNYAILASPRYDPPSLSVLIADTAGFVYALRAVDGQPFWSQPYFMGARISATPCTDSIRWFVFSETGTAQALFVKDGSVAWGSAPVSVTNDQPGFYGSPALSLPQSGLSATIGAGAANFQFYILNSETGQLVCSCPLNGPVRNGIAVTNSTFLVPTEGNSVYGLMPFVGTCWTAFRIDNLYSPARAAVDGMLGAYVGCMDAVVALDVQLNVPGSSSRVKWVYNATGEEYNAIALGPHGTVYASTARTGALMHVGATVAYVQSAVRDAVMLSASQPSVSRVSLNLLTAVCNLMPLVPTEDVSVVAAIQQGCSLRSVVQAGLYPWGSPFNYADYHNSSGLINWVVTDIAPLIDDAQANLNNMSASGADLEQVIGGALVMIANYDERLQAQQLLVNRTAILLSGIVGSIATAQLQAELATVVLMVQITDMLTTWERMAANFSAAAASHWVAGVQDYHEAVADLGLAVHSLLSPWIWGDVKGNVEGALTNLGKAIENIAESGVFGVLAVEYEAAWVELVQVSQYFISITEFNTVIFNTQGNISIPEKLPFIVGDAISLESIRQWLKLASQAMSDAYGGSGLLAAIETFISATEAVLVLDWAFYTTFQQYQAETAQLSVIQMQLQSAKNALAVDVVERAGVGHAVMLAEAQLYNVQLEAMRISDRACQQFAYWSLTRCSKSLAPYPTHEDILDWVNSYNSDVDEATQAPTDEGWAQVGFSRTVNPDAFSFSENGTFLLNVQLASDPIVVDVRTADFRVYFLPEDLQLNSSVVSVSFNHSGSALFMDEKGTVHNFTHPGYQNTLFFEPNTRGCPLTEQTCSLPQCGPYFSLSPYGLWTIQVAPSLFSNMSAVETIVLQFHVHFINPSNRPSKLILFAGSDGLTPQFPVLPCTDSTVQ